MAAAPQPPPQYIALPGDGIRDPKVLNMLGSFALSDFAHDFGKDNGIFTNVIKTLETKDNKIFNISDVDYNKRLTDLRTNIQKEEAGFGTSIFEFFSKPGRNIPIQYSLPDFMRPEGRILAEENYTKPANEENILNIIFGDDTRFKNSLSRVRFNKDVIMNDEIYYYKPNGVADPVVVGPEGVDPEGAQAEIFGKNYRITASPVKWKIDGERNIVPLAHALTKTTKNATRNFVFMIDASNLAFTDLKTHIPAPAGGVQYNFYILSNIENDSDPATKISEVLGDNPNINVYFLREKENKEVIYPSVKEESDGISPVFFSKNTIKLERNLKNKNIDATIIDDQNNVVLEVPNLGTSSEIAEASRLAMATYLNKDFQKKEVDLNNKVAKEHLDLKDTVREYEKMVQYLMLKRAGDWCQALSLADTTREYDIYDSRFRNKVTIPDPANPANPAKDYTTLYDLQKIGCEIALVTHDRVLLSYALLNGVNVIFSQIKKKNTNYTPMSDITWMIYYKNLATVGNQGPLIEQKKQNILFLLTDQPKVPNDILGTLKLYKESIIKQFETEKQRIYNDYSAKIITPGIFDDSTEGPRDITGNDQFRVYVTLIRTMVFKLSELNDPNQINIPDSIKIDLNGLTAMETILKELQKVQINNNTVFMETYLPTNNNNEDYIIDNLIIFEQSPYYSSENINSKDNELGKFINSVGKNKKTPVGIYKQFVDIILTQIRKQFLEIENWKILEQPGTLGELINNNLLPQRLGEPFNQDTRRGKLDNRLTILQELMKVFTIQPIQEGGGIGDNYITRTLKTQKVNTLLIGQIDPLVLNDNYKNMIIESQDISDETKKLLVDNTYIQAFIKKLYEIATGGKLQEPLFTNYVKTGFAQLIAQYLDNYKIVNSDEKIIDFIHKNIAIEQFTIDNRSPHEEQHYEPIPRGSTYYDIENYPFTVVDDFILDSSHQTAIINILQGQYPPLPPSIPAPLPQGGVVYQFVRKNIPFFVYRFLIYYLDLILQRIQKLPEDIPSHIDYTGLDKFIFYGNPRNKESNYILYNEEYPGGTIQLTDRNTFIRHNGDIVIYIGNLVNRTAVCIIMDSDSEEVKLEKNKIDYELSFFHPNVYLGNQFGQEGGTYYFNILRDNFLYNFGIKEMDIDLEDKSLFKKDLYNKAKFIQFKYIILYYMYMFYGYNSEAQYDIINNIKPHFLKIFGDIDVLNHIHNEIIKDNNFADMIQGHINNGLISNYTTGKIIKHITDTINEVLRNRPPPPPAGGGRRTRKQRKTHRGVKTRSTKPRKQSPRRHKKRSKKTRKH